MTGAVIYDPLLPWPLLAALGALALVAVTLALARGLAGWALRGLALAALLAALANPAWQREDRAALSDIVIAVVDDSASQQLGTRPDQTAQALAAVRAEVAALPGTELRVVHLGDAPGDGGTLLLGAWPRRWRPSRGRGWPGRS